MGRKLYRSAPEAAAAAIVLAAFCALPDSACAIIYKWEDGKNAALYTDDLSNIPQPFRRPDIIFKDSQNLHPPGASKAEEVEGQKAAPADPSEVEKAIKAALADAISFLLSEIPRDEGLAAYVPNSVNGKAILYSLNSGLPAKKALAGSLVKIENPLLQEFLGFLKSDIADDERLDVLAPRFKFNVHETIARLQQRLPQKKDYLARLQKEQENPTLPKKKTGPGGGQPAAPVDAGQSPAADLAGELERQLPTK